MDYIISVDLGTTAIKVALFDSEGRVVAKSTQEYTLLTPTTLGVELPVETYWQAFKTGIVEVMERSGLKAAQIRALGISAQGETLILTGKEATPLRNAIVWLDNRAQKQAEVLNNEFGEDLTYKTTGQVSIVPTWPASKLAWVRENEPEVFKKIDKVLLIEDYFIRRMTGITVAEGSLLCSTVYWDINKKVYWKPMLERLGIEESQLPEIRESGEPVGPLLPAVAGELGLHPDTVVCTGALDQAAGAIGVGNINPGVFSENTGAALAICATVDHPIIDPKGRMPCHYHGLPDTYMAHTFTTGGMVLKWFRDIFCQAEMQVGQLLGTDSYNVIGEEASRIDPGSDGLVMLPHLQGAMAPEANPKAKGVFYGITMRHTRAHFARAILEAVACIVRRNIEVVEELGIGVSEIRCLGGGSRSSVWNQIKADLTGRPVVTMENEEAACLGAAILAGKGVGMFKSLEGAVSQMVQIKDRFEPDPKTAAFYTGHFQKYVVLYDSLVGMFAKETEAEG
jgi:sugar (pentulose or hexulose) kinase